MRLCPRRHTRRRHSSGPRASAAALSNVSAPGRRARSSSLQARVSNDALLCFFPCASLARTFSPSLVLFPLLPPRSRSPPRALRLSLPLRPSLLSLHARSLTRSRALSSSPSPPPSLSGMRGLSALPVATTLRRIHSAIALAPPCSANLPPAALRVQTRHPPTTRQLTPPLPSTQHMRAPSRRSRTPPPRLPRAPAAPRTPPPIHPPTAANTSTHRRRHHGATGHGPVAPSPPATASRRDILLRQHTGASPHAASSPASRNASASAAVTSSPPPSPPPHRRLAAASHALVGPHLDLAPKKEGVVEELDRLRRLACRREEHRPCAATAEARVSAPAPRATQVHAARRACDAPVGPAHQSRESAPQRPSSRPHAPRCPPRGSGP